MPTGDGGRGHDVQSLPVLGRDVGAVLGPRVVTTDGLRDGDVLLSESPTTNTSLGNNP